MILSAEQEAIKNAFATGKKNFIVDAKAGTGKTTTAEKCIPFAKERKVCYTVFNKRNVLEAKEKIKDPRVRICSLNGLGHGFVMRNWPKAQPDDSVEYDRLKLAGKASKYPQGRLPMTQARDLMAFAKNTSPFAELEDLIRICVARGIGVEEWQETAGWSDALLCELVLEAMDIAKRPDSQNRISFNDQIWLPVVMGWAQPWYDLMVVDEAQDLNFTQIQLIGRACKKTGRTVLIGDPNQSLYGFRGADPDTIKKFQEKHGCEILPLTTTYRCPKAVVREANQIVPNYVAYESNADGLVTTLSGSKVLAEIKVGDALLSRVNAPLMPICLELLRRGVPTYIEGRDIGRTLLGIVEKVEDDGTLTKFLEGLTEWMYKRCAMLASKEGSESAIENVMDQGATLTALAEDSKDVADLKRRLGILFSDSTGERPRSVVLSSVHRAKGLEWNRVFVLRDTLAKSAFSPAGGEASRIAYVAITRAKEHLTWVVGEVVAGAKKKAADQDPNNGKEIAELIAA